MAATDPKTRLGREEKGLNGMRIAIGQFSSPDPARLRYCRQLGASGVVLNTPDLPAATGRWELDDLRALRQHVEAFGLRLEALENTPLAFYDQAIWGGPDRDTQIANYIATVTNVGRAGIPLLGYHWMANGVWRTGWEPVGRGGAVVSVFHQAAAPTALTHGRRFTEDELWDHYDYFMRRVLPAAEAAGVRLALHPDDPPVPELGGVPRLFRRFEAFRDAAERYRSPAWMLDFCLGTWSEMGPGLADKLRYFVRAGRVAYVHFRDVRGYGADFEECFLEEGNYDPVEIMTLLVEEDFPGFAIDDHVPLLEGDEGWGERGRAWATGYLQGLLAAVQHTVRQRNRVR
jgi:mannonate dehydratase